MDLSLWPRVRKLFVDWGYRGLKEMASSLSLELEVVARPYAGVRGVWVREGEEVPEIPRGSRFKPLQEVGSRSAPEGLRPEDLCLAGAEPAALQGLWSAVRLPCAKPPGERSLGLSGHATIAGEAAG